MTEEENKQEEYEIIEDDAEEIIEEDIPDGKHFVKRKRRERIVRKGRLKQARFKGIIRFFLCIILMFGLYYGLNLKGWYLDSEVFNKVDSGAVEIINNKIVSSSKVLALLKNSNVPNKPIYMVRVNSIKKELLKLTPIENVYIRKYAFPARIQIIIRERTPVISISPDESKPPVAFFTTDGKIIGKEFLPLDDSFKTILVLTYGNKGDDYHKWDLNKINEIQKIVKYIETYSKESVEYVDFKNPNDIYVKIKTVNIRLGKLDNEIYKRIERISSILPQLKTVNSDIKYLDLSWEKVNYIKLK